MAQAPLHLADGGVGLREVTQQGGPRLACNRAVTLASLSALSDMHISPGGTKSEDDVRSHLWWLEYAWPMGSDTIRCALVGGGGRVALLEEVCHCKDRF